MLVTQRLEELGGEFAVLMLMDFPAHDASAPDIEVKVEIEVVSSQRCVSQVRDVPTQKPKRFARNVLARLVVALSRLASFPVGIELSLGENSPQGPLRADVSASVGELRNGLLGTQIAIGGAVDERHDAVLLFLRQRVRWPSIRTLSFIDWLRLPSLEGAY